MTTSHNKFVVDDDESSRLSTLLSNSLETMWNAFNFKTIKEEPTDTEIKSHTVPNYIKVKPEPGFLLRHSRGDFKKETEDGGCQSQWTEEGSWRNLIKLASSKP